LKEFGSSFCRSFLILPQTTTFLPSFNRPLSILPRMSNFTSSTPTESYNLSLIPLPFLFCWTAFYPLLFFTFTRFLWPVHFARHQTKRRAWIHSGATAVITTCLGLPFVMDFVLAGGDVGKMNERRREQGGKGRELLGQLVCTGYLGFLISDLVHGSMLYREVSGVWARFRRRADASSRRRRRV